MSKSLLFLSYLFPPRGGAGVQRPLKFCKYLPQFGWNPLVVANGGTAADFVTTMQDPTLLKDLPEGAVVRYTALTPAERRNFERYQSRLRQKFTATDPMGWWVDPAVRLAMELYHEHHPSAIFVTMSPFTSAEAGIRLKHLTRLPLILDLRDPWAMDETKIYQTRWHAWRDWAAMRRAMLAADLVIMNTPESKRAAEESFRFRPETKVISLTNGFDADDFGHSTIDPAPPDVLRIVHTGMFHSEMAKTWDDLYAGKGLINKLKCPRRPINLWTRTPRYLLAAMQKAVSTGQIPEGKLELVLVGEVTENDRQMVESSPAARMSRLLGYRTHTESVGWLQSADLLFLPNHTPLDGGPALIVPGKTYEYLGSQRPILSMGPAGDMKNFIQQANAGDATPGDDTEAAAQILIKAYTQKIQKRPTRKPDQKIVESFERKPLAQKLAQELNELMNRSDRRASPN